MTFTPSPEQSAIFDHISTGASNLIISACPGSGKTTTSMEAMSYCRKSSGFVPTSILYLVFAKANEEEAKARAPKGVTVSTFHSLGFRALKAAGHNPTVAGTFDYKTKKRIPPKVAKLVWDVLGSTDPEAQSVIRLVGLLKSVCAADAARASELCDLHNIEISSKNISLALKVLERSDADLKTVDFDDMLRLPVILGVPFAPWDYVFVDEAQDTNEIQMEILWRLQKRLSQIIVAPAPSNSTRFIIVGDPHQSIYGFRGAQTSAMSTLREKFQCTELPLSLSYRCPKAVVNEARRVLNLSSAHPIHAHPDAPEGMVRTLVSYDPQTFTLPCIILCRTTAPLIGMAYSLLKRGVSATVRGKDIGAGLIALIRRMKAVDLLELTQKLSLWHRTETERCEALRRSTEHTDNQYECLCAIITRVSEVPSSTIPTVLAALESLFSDDKDERKVLLSTIHRAKGLEYPTVFILNRETTLPSRYALTPEAKEQERNLWYVAVTRSQGSLFYITLNCWTKT